MGTQTFYLSGLIKEVGFDKATEKATELRAKGHIVIVDAESIIDRNGDDAWDILDGLKKKGYGIKINQATLDRMFKDKSAQAYELAFKRGWQVYSQPAPAQKAQMAQPMQPAHLPEQERTALFASMPESPHQTPPSYQGPTMRAATPQEQQAMLKATVPAAPKSAEEMNSEWAARRGLIPSMIDPATYVNPRPEAQTIPGRAAERALDAGMQPLAAGMRSVLLPQRYWESAKALSNILSNSTGQAANALGLGNYKYSDWYKSKSKSLDEDLGKALGPIEDVTTVLWRDPIVALGVLGAATRTIADMGVTPFTSEQTGARVAGATLKEAPLTAALVDPVGSAFESVGDVAAKAYEAAGGTPGTADKLRGLGTVAMLAAFNMASSRRIEAIRRKVEKGEKLTAEEQKVADAVALEAPTDQVQQSLQELELNAKTNAEVLDKAKENKIVIQAVEPQQQIRLSPEAQSAEAITSLKPVAKQPWEMTKEEFLSNTKDQREGYSEGILSLKGWGEPGITVENRSIKVGNRIDEGIDITYRNKDGLPVAIARLTKDANGNMAVDDFGVRRNIGLLRGRAVLEVGKEIERIGADKPLDSISSDAAKLYHHRAVQKAIPEGKPVPPEVLAEYPDLAKQQVTPPAETMPPKQMMGVADPIGAAVQAVRQATQPPPRPDLTEKPRSLYEEPEQYFEQNKGIQINEPGLWAKARDGFIRLKQSFQRSRPNIDPRASVPETVTQETLRRYQDAPERAQVNAVDTIYQFTRELGPKRKDLLYRVVMLEDLAKDLESGLTDISEKPLGYDSVEKVNADVQQMRAKMLSDPKTAEAYGKRQQLFRPIVNSLVEAGRLPEEALDDPRYYHHQILEHYTEGGQQLGSRDLRLHKKGFERQRTGSAKALNTEGVESDFEWLSGAYYQLHTLEAQAKIKQAADKSMELGLAREVIKEATGTDPGIQIPEGYVEWQVPPNHPFFKAATLPERIINEVMNEGAAVVEPGDLRQLTAVGKGETWIIPENIAKELDNITHRREQNWLGDRARKINNAWKRWVILNPWRATKYMLNNLTGDLDAIISIAPGTMRFAQKNSVKLWNKVWKNEATPEFQKLYDEAMSKSILQSGLTLEEIPNVKKLPALRLLQATLNDKSPFWKRPDKMILAASRTYWKNTNLLNIWRESVLRLSAYEYWKERVGKSGKRQYGASDRATIDQMYEAVKEGKLDLNDVAARLARDTLGDYGNVSQAGQWMRRTTHPFWSWVEINVPRYYHLFKNIGAEGKGTDLAGAAAYGGARLAGKAAWKAAKVYAFSQAFFAAVNLYNKTVYPQEDKLINKAKGELYLITPFKNDDGSRRVVRFSGALSDALSMFGLRDYIRDVPELIQGKQKAKDVAWQVLSSVPEQLWQRMGPGLKALPEIGLQRQTYPRFLTDNWPKDVTSIRDMVTTGRPIRSDWQQLWKYAALDWVYNAYRRGTGRPFPQRDAALADLITTSVDTNQAAYYAIREKTYDFLRERNSEKAPPSMYDDKANAAYFFKVASQIGDKDAARYWFREYMRLSKNDYAKQLANGKIKKDFITYSLDNLNKSIEASSPLGALSGSGQEAEFIRSLTPEDKEMLNAAMRWYHRKLPYKPKK